MKNEIDHSPYIRLAKNSQKAVVMVHGIAGSPAHFRKLMPAVPEDWSVYNILLDGHGKGVKEFGRSSMSRWREQVRQTVAQLLPRHEQIVLVGHSMGTLLCIREAIRHEDRIHGLFLLAVPTRPWVRLSTMVTSLRVMLGDRTSRAALAMVNDCSIHLDRRIWNYLTWIPRMLELLAECRAVRAMVPQLTVKTWTFQSQTDELVSIRSCNDLEQNAHIKNTVLPNSGHFDYGEDDAQFLREQLSQLLKLNTTT